MDTIATLANNPMTTNQTLGFLNIAARIFLAGLASLSGSALHAEESDSVYYAGFHLGRNDLDNWPAKVDFGAGIVVDGGMDLDSGKHVGLLLGKQSERARFELEYQQGRFELANLRLGPLSEPMGGSGHYEALTLNAYRRIPLHGDLSGFVGAGIGWGAISLPQAGFFGGCHCFPHASKSDWVYQGRLGLEYLIGAGNFAFAQYTWLKLPGAAEEVSSDGPGVVYPRRSVGIFSIGYRSLF